MNRRIEEENYSSKGFSKHSQDGLDKLKDERRGMPARDEQFSAHRTQQSSYLEKHSSTTSTTAASYSRQGQSTLTGTGYEKRSHLEYGEKEVQSKPYQGGYTEKQASVSSSSYSSKQSQGGQEYGKERGHYDFSGRESQSKPYQASHTEKQSSPASSVHGKPSLASLDKGKDEKYGQFDLGKRAPEEKKHPIGQTGKPQLAVIPPYGAKESQVGAVKMNYDKRSDHDFTERDTGKKATYETTQKHTAVTSSGLSKQSHDPLGKAKDDKRGYDFERESQTKTHQTGQKPSPLAATGKQSYDTLGKAKDEKRGYDFERESQTKYHQTGHTERASSQTSTGLGKPPSYDTHGKAKDEKHGYHDFERESQTKSHQTGHTEKQSSLKSGGLSKQSQIEREKEQKEREKREASNHAYDKWLHSKQQSEAKTHQAGHTSAGLSKQSLTKGKDERYDQHAVGKRESEAKNHHRTSSARQDATTSSRYNRQSQDSLDKRRSSSLHDTDDDSDDSRQRSRKSIEEDSDSDSISSSYEASPGEREPWRSIKTAGAKAPGDFVVTHINQTHDLLRGEGVTASKNVFQSSTEWLTEHGIESLKLTVRDLLLKGKFANDRKDGKPVPPHIVFDATVIHETEYKLNIAIEMYTKRLNWLLEGGTRPFGVIQGKRIGLIIDSSDACCGFGRLTEYLESLMKLLGEQVLRKKQLFVVAYGTEIKELWPDAVDINLRSIDEAKMWISRLQCGGGSNLLQALKRTTRVSSLDSVVVVCGSVPDQPMSVISHYWGTVCVGNDQLKLQTIGYNLDNRECNKQLKEVAERYGGRFHCYSRIHENLFYEGTDFRRLVEEINKAQGILAKIREMRSGIMGNLIVTIENEISMEVAQANPSNLLPHPPGHDQALRIEVPNFRSRTSEEWLQQHGLNVKKLNLYQVLAPNAYAPIEDFVPILRKTVQSQVHERAMAQFEWHDGTMKNLHVDLAVLYDFQKRLGAAVRLFERRTDWLSTGSRAIFGTIVENKIVLVIDASMANAKYIVHIQHSLRMLMEEQLSNKEFFNIIAFGSEVRKWRPTMVKPTHENLEDAWRWVLQLSCSGTRNVLAALHACFENETERKHKILPEGIYLFTSGIPDQPIQALTLYLHSHTAGVQQPHVHTALFNVDDYDSQGPLPGRWANITTTADTLRQLAHCTGGRFHWFREKGIVESDDVIMLNREIERAINFSQKSAVLADSVRSARAPPEEPPPRLLPLRDQEPRRAILPPKHTALSLARVHKPDNPSAALWRPTNTNRQDLIPPEPKGKSRAHSAPGRPKKEVEVAKEAFYTGNRNQVGTVIRDYPRPKSVRKQVPIAVIPDKEEILTTKEWMRKYSLSKLKLDLYKLVCGPECRHDTVRVPTLRKDVEARHCTVFPSVNVRGTIRHLQLRPGEIEEYEEQVDRVLRRYIARMQWLLSGSRRVFGVVRERNVAVLVDCSGSMAPYMGELKKELAALIWEQLHPVEAVFNLFRFSNTCERWREIICTATEDNCHNAIAWVSSLFAHGNTCTLEALEMAFEDESIEAVYLLSDGKPDTSTVQLLQRVEELNQQRNVPVHTISFNCHDSTADEFLRQLAQRTTGRYHRAEGGKQAFMFAHEVLNEGVTEIDKPRVPEFHGDDLVRLAREISKAIDFIVQSRTFRSMFPKTRDDPALEDAVVNAAC